MKSVSEWKWLNEGMQSGAKYQPLIDAFMPQPKMARLGIGQHEVQTVPKEELFKNRKSVSEHLSALPGDEAAIATASLCHAFILKQRSDLINVLMWFLYGEDRHIEPNKIPDWVAK